MNKDKKIERLEQKLTKAQERKYLLIVLEDVWPKQTDL